MALIITEGKRKKRVEVNRRGVMIPGYRIVDLRSGQERIVSKSEFAKIEAHADVLDEVLIHRVVEKTVVREVNSRERPLPQSRQDEVLYWE